MIQIITGQTGEGKTKQMIQLANEQCQTIKGEVVYIDSTTHHRYDLSHHIRLIEPSTIPLRPHDFFGFLCGILSSNHDIELIFIDELIKMTRFGLDELTHFIENLKKLSQQFNVDFVVGASCSKQDIPAPLLSYLVA